jgi:hypothetical protein
MASRGLAVTWGGHNVGTEGADGFSYRVRDPRGADGAKGDLALLDAADHRDVDADASGELLPCEAGPYAGLLHAGPE